MLNNVDSTKNRSEISELRLTTWSPEPFVRSLQHWNYYNYIIIISTSLLLCRNTNKLYRLFPIFLPETITLRFTCLQNALLHSYVERNFASWSGIQQGFGPYVFVGAMGNKASQVQRKHRTPACHHVACSNWTADNCDVSSQVCQWCARDILRSLFGQSVQTWMRWRKYWLQQHL